MVGKHKRNWEGGMSHLLTPPALEGFLVVVLCAPGVKLNKRTENAQERGVLLQSRLAGCAQK
jgi:hypothetical protein